MMVEGGVTREHFGAAAIACRTHAQRNPMALMQKPLTMDDYLAAHDRRSDVSVRLLPESDGSLACVDHQRRARARSAPASRVHPRGRPGHGAERVDHDQLLQAQLPRRRRTATSRDLWQRSDIQPKDVRCAQLYTPTPLILVSLE
jgi:hypothetical protein